MNTYFLAWFLLAVILSWAMGAYNRLMRLRAKGLLAFSYLEQTLEQQMTLLSAHFLEAEAVLDEASRYRHSFFASVSAVNSGLKIAHSQPFNGVATRDLSLGIDAMGLYWCQLVDLPPDLTDSFLPKNFQSQWELLAFQVALARGEFNQSVINYNDAKNEFPANMLAKVFGFKSAQPV